VSSHRNHRSLSLCSLTHSLTCCAVLCCAMLQVSARHPLGRGLPRILLLLHYRQRRGCPALRCGVANTKRLFVNKLFLHYKRSIYQDRLGTSIVAEEKLRGKGRSLLQAVKRDSSIAPALEQGDYGPLKAWLTENVWRHGMTRVAPSSSLCHPRHF